MLSGLFNLQITIPFASRANSLIILAPQLNVVKVLVVCAVLETEKKQQSGEGGRRKNVSEMLEMSQHFCCSL